MSILYIADTHFGHASAIRFDNRPFASVDEMQWKMMQNWNNRVLRTDDVYILGDFCLKLDAEHARKIAANLNGHKHLILGNHDKKNAERYRDVFQSVEPSAVVKDMVCGQKRTVYVSHYFVPFYWGAHHMGYMLHGHTHKSAESNYEEKIKEYIRNQGLRCEAYNVGCMWQDYIPQTLEEIIARQERKIEV